MDHDGIGQQAQCNRSVGKFDLKLENQNAELITWPQKRKKGKGLSTSAVQSKWHTKKGPISDMKKGDSSYMCIYARESKRQYKG
ncbi:hypothetical protein C5167_020138 [Papaver somniferum]|uniref:Uncharacterized protein n=1 Tax=Papaver somniferum TaxID=3469 RepID=A0A4Y7IW26_PAPSO|nr:hypothetical protein C5167_020138 [Papaver somniferum]